MLDNEMVHAIKDRKNLLSKYLSVSKMLELNGMSNYKRVCCMRILDFADDSHIVFDIFACDVLIDDVGLSTCYDILQGYISSKNLSDYKIYIEATNKVIQSQNEQLKAMRDCPTKHIKKLLENPSKYFNAELQHIFADMLQIELKARKPLNKLRVAIKQIIKRIASYIRNYKSIKCVNRYLKEISQEL